MIGNEGRLPDLKEKLFIFGVISAIFLPVRMVFYAYLSAHWIGSLGLVSSLMFVLVLLAHKKKLGRFGNIFLKQLTKTIKGKYGKLAIFFSLMLIAYCTTTIMWIEHGNTIYSDEKNLVSKILFSNNSVNQMDEHDIHTIMKIKHEGMMIGPSDVVYIDQILSITYAMMNDMMGGWMINLDVIIIVEQIEFLGFILVYRKICKPSILLTN